MTVTAVTVVAAVTAVTAMTTVTNDHCNTPPPQGDRSLQLSPAPPVAAARAALAPAGPGPPHRSAPGGGPSRGAAFMPPARRASTGLGRTGAPAHGRTCRAQSRRSRRHGGHGGHDCYGGQRIPPPSSGSVSQQGRCGIGARLDPSLSSTDRTYS